MKARWTINGDFFGLASDGVARYAASTAQALDTLVAEQHPLTRNIDIDIVAPKTRADLAFNHIPVKLVPEFRTPRLPQVWCQLQLPAHVPGGLLSFCNLAPVRVRKHIVCIHDMHTRLMPHDYSRGFRWVHRAVLPALGRSAAAITTVSELSRADLVAFGIAPAEKITVTYNGADHAHSWGIDQPPHMLPRSRPFVLGFGRPQPYKNTALFWRIASALDERGLDIVLVGDLPPSIADSYGPKPANLHLVGRVNDTGLAHAMKHALCLVFPSRIEGFGLPAVEAMIMNCPVIASTAKALAEICGDAALFADPEAPDQWIIAIDQLRATPTLRQQLIARGQRRAELFSWRRIAETYLQLMAEIDARKD
jgi:glycosyltransferase involved in cell wall biosynthesis